MSGRTASVLIVISATLALSALRPAPVSAALIGYWSFDGCTTTDASGNGANLTAVNGPTCVPGRFGNAWQLDGTSQYLERGSDAAFTPGTRAWTVAAWVKSTGVTNYGYILTWYRCGANPACSGDFAFYGLALHDGHPYWDIRDDVGSDLSIEPASINLADGAWHLLAGTMNPATDSLKLYVDGALNSTLPGPIGNLSSGGVPIPLEVGRVFRTGWGSPGDYFPGSIDELRIYDQELSAASVASLFFSNTTGVSADQPVDFSIDGATPNPSRGGSLVVAFTLRGVAPARLALFDVAGRLVSERAFGTPDAGRHQVDLAEGGRLAPGVYLIRLTQGVRSRTRRVTVLD